MCGIRTSARGSVARHPCLYLHNRHYAKSRVAQRAALRRSPLQRRHHARRFLEARLRLRLTQAECADLLQITPRTLRYWEAGSVRIPHAAYRLLRVLGGGRYLDDPAWRSFTVRGDVLVTPEGHEFPAGDLAWWSLLVRQAREYRTARAQLRALQDAPHAAGANGAQATVAPAAGVAPCAASIAEAVSVAGLAVQVDRLGCPLVASAGQAVAAPFVQRELPTSNRGVSETERDASESVPLPCSGAAPLAQPGGAAPAFSGVPA